MAESEIWPSCGVKSKRNLIYECFSFSACIHVGEGDLGGGGNKNDDPFNHNQNLASKLICSEIPARSEKAFEFLNLHVPSYYLHYITKKYFIQSVQPRCELDHFICMLMHYESGSSHQ